MTVARPIWLQNLSNYSADEFRTLLDAGFATTGVIRNAAAVAAHSPVAASVDVGVGYVVVGAKSAANGKYLVEITATETVTITANASGNARKDIIVVEVDDTAFSDASDIAVVKAVAGTPSGSPVAPTPTANQTILAEILVANGFSTIGAGVITDRRARSLPGVGPRGYMTSGQRITTSSAVSAEAVLTVNASFTLAETRRIRYEYGGRMVASATTTGCRLLMRRNATGAAITTSDALLVWSEAIGGGSVARSFSEVLAPGTYGVGLALSGVTTGTATLVAASDNPCVIEVHDLGEV